MIKNTITRLNSLIKEVPQKIKSLPYTKMKESIAKGKWQRIEILGHLCDSAINNISRVIRVQFEEQPFKIISYKQSYWVELNNYRNQKAGDVAALWVVLNKQFVEIISTIPEVKLRIDCLLESGETKTLEWLIDDYLAHLEYHLGQIF
jgi:hypothetical protein